MSVPAGDSASPPIDCNSFAAAHDFPTAGVRRLNPELPCHDLRGQTVCSPVTCTRLIVGQQISARAFASSTALSTIGVTEVQFWTWNLFLSMGDVLQAGDSVCVA